MPTGSDDVRFQGRTGSNQTTVKMTRLTQRGLSMNLPLLHSLRQGFVSKYAWIICFVSIGPESFAGRRGEIANGRGAGVKPHTKSAALAIVMIASSSVVEAQEDGRPSTASPPGTTQGPWTSVKPGNSESRCSPGEYAVGIEVEVAPPGPKPCAGCVSRLRVICRRYGI